MNPMKWHSIQNGGNLNDTRETINGFPCRLILINDGETPLNEGQNEPTPGNVKDMGIFNFNNDKGNTDTFGLDNSIFPRCVSYEVVANSDTSAGAFVPFLYKKRIGFKKNGGEYNTGQIPIFLPKETTIKYECPVRSEIRFYNNGTRLSQVAHENTIAYTNISVPSNATHMFFVMRGSVPEEIKFDGVPYECAETAIGSTSLEELYTEADELAYLQDSFELRYPDDKEVGADYGMLGMTVDGVLSSEYGLKRVIDWVGNATNEEFVANFEQYFNKEYTFRYYLLVITLG